MYEDVSAVTKVKTQEPISHFFLPLCTDETRETGLENESGQYRSNGHREQCLIPSPGSL